MSHRNGDTLVFKSRLDMPSDNAFTHEQLRIAKGTGNRTGSDHLSNCKSHEARGNDMPASGSEQFSTQAHQAPQTVPFNSGSGE
jgi:hypothetical protein